MDQCDLLNNHFGTKGAWDTIYKLKSCLSKTRPAAVKQIKSRSTCQAPEQKAEVFRAHFQKLYGRLPDYDQTVVDIIQQQATIEGCDHSPTDEEIRTAVDQLRDSGPGDSSLCAQ